MSHKVCHQPRTLRMVCANRSKAISIKRHACAAQKWFSRLYKTLVSIMMAVTHSKTQSADWGTVISGTFLERSGDLPWNPVETLDVTVLQVLVRVARASGNVGLTYGMWRKCMWRWADCVASGKSNGGKEYSTQILLGQELNPTSYTEGKPKAMLE